MQKEITLLIITIGRVFSLSGIVIKNHYNFHQIVRIYMPCRRFYFLKENKPKIYEHFMQMQNNGISYRDALRFCGINFPDSRVQQTELNFKD
jgi:hypothetical protein